MNILVADDSRMARKIVMKSINETLSNIDINIIEACNGVEALDAYKQNQIDFVFLDLTMPVMDGFQALQEIKKFDKNAKVIVVSADIQKTSMDKVREFGAIDFVKKPISLEKMDKIVEKIL
ncbi:response regulator [Malaciobacter halophilus]|uniref:Response regulator n=1 Tax=Malaciobacter halophilus TaxID=197482 RepID=A0A2N1J6V0_9BACT|nr:response regulator [Malaciobacter halophilus]AXH09964.1 two-component system response regulator [Malaciobacter halophilus]PKI82182.1 response regulator [Malaciobacter halophilus]